MNADERQAAFQNFVAKWTHPEYPAQVPKDAELQDVEKTFAVQLPAAYRSFLLEHGAVSPGVSLLNSIVTNELDIADLSALCEPQEVIDDTTGWRESGLPVELFAIGSDCSGNLFCFRQDDCQKPTEDAPIYLWDHDFDETEKVADSFTDWILAFNGIELVEELEE